MDRPPDGRGSAPAGGSARALSPRESSAQARRPARRREEPAKLPRSRRIAAVLAVSEATAYLHGSGIVHGDICPENLLRFPRGRTKLCDFGYSHPEGKPPTAFPDLVYYQGEPSCAPPESYSRAKQSLAGDVYRLGTTCWQLLAGEAPTLPKRGAPQLDLARVPKAYCKVLASCLDLNPAARPEADAAAEQLLQATLSYLRAQVKKQGEADGKQQ